MIFYLNKNMLFVLILTVFYGVSCTIDTDKDLVYTEVTVPDEAHNIVKTEAIADPMAQLMSMILGPQPDGLDNLLKGLLQNRHKDMLAKIAQERNDTLKSLPESVRDSIESIYQTYQRSESIIKVENILIKIFQDVFSFIENAPESFFGAMSQSLLLEKLKKLHTFITTGTLVASLSPASISPAVILQNASSGNFDITQLMPMLNRIMGINSVHQDEIISPSEVKELIIFLQSIEKNEISEIHTLAFDSINQLIAVLDAVLQRDSKKIITLCMPIIITQLSEVQNTLQYGISLLSDQLLITTNNNALAAITYWLTLLKNYQKTIKSFITVSNFANIDLSILMSSASSLYQIIASIISLERKNHSIISQVNAIDGSLRFAIAIASCAHNLGNAAAQTIRQQIFGDEPISKFVNPFNSWEYQLPIVIGGFTGFFNPGSFSSNLGLLQRAFWRICGCYFWQHITEKSIIDQFSWSGDAPMVKKAVLATIVEAQGQLNNFLQGYVTQSLDPIFLEKIKQFSAGLIKPELIGLFLEIAVPALFINQLNGYDNVKKIIHLKANDFIQGYVGYDFLRGLNHQNWFFNNKTILVNPMRGQQSIFDDNIARYAIQLYVCYMLTNYVMKNLGSSAGAFIGKQVGLVDHVVIPLYKLLQNSSEQTKDAPFNQSLDLEMIKTLVKSILLGTGFQREMIINLLKSANYIPMNEFDHYAINRSLVMLLFSYLTRFNLLGHREVADLYSSFLRDQENIGSFIDEILATIKTNISSTIGSIAGEMVGNIATDFIVWKWGPKLIG